MVSRVSRVLFSFSEPMELMTMLPTIIMMIMITIGIIRVSLLTWLEISDGVTSMWISPLTTVPMSCPEDTSGLDR